MPAKRTSPDVWGSENRVYPVSSGRPGKRDPAVTPYMIPFARAFQNHLYETVALITGTQGGKTDTMLDIIGWRIATKPRPQLYVGPSRDFVTEQFEPRLMALFDESDDLKSRVARGKRNKRFVKIVNGVRIRLAWAGSPASLASDQAGDVFVDEYSKMFRTKNKAGDPLVLAKARADTYADRKIGITSTPENGRCDTETDAASGLEFWKVTDPDDITCQTWLRWQTGTRHHWSWKCPHCASWFIPRYRDLKWPDEATPAEARRETFLCCPVNGCVIDEDQKDEMNVGGQMVAPGQFIRDDGTIGGDPPDSTTISFWVSGLASPFLSWGERVEEILLAEAVGDPSALKAAINKVGELYYKAPVAAINEEHLANKRLPDVLMGDVPREVIKLTLGADVQGNRIVYVIRGWGAQARSWQVAASEVWGRTSEIDVWSRFALVLQQTYGGLRIEKGLIDSGFRPDKKEAGDYHKVYDFCRAWNWIIQPAKGKDKQSVPVVIRPVEATAEGKSKGFAINLVHLDSDFFKSLVHSRLWTSVGQPQSMHLSQDCPAQYMKEILSEIRDQDGVWHSVYRENHFLDAEALAAAAGYIAQVHAIPEGTIRDEGFKVPRQNEPNHNLKRPEAAQVGSSEKHNQSVAQWARRFNRR